MILKLVSTQYLSFQKETEINFQCLLRLGNPLEKSPYGSKTGPKKSVANISVLKNGGDRDSYKRITDVFLKKKNK